MILRSTAESKMDACADTKEAAWAVYEKELEAREDRKYGEELERRHKRQAVPTVVSEGKSGTTDDSDAASTASTASPARDAFCQALAATPFLCGPRDELFFHGRGYDGPASSTDVPNTTWQSRKPPRDDHDAPDWLKASEFADTKTVNAHKCRQLAELLRMSKKTVLYTGAGISASVIGQAARSGQNKQGWMSDVRLLCLPRPSAGMLAAPTIHNLSTATRCFVSTLPSAASIARFGPQGGLPPTLGPSRVRSLAPRSLARASLTTTPLPDSRRAPIPRPPTTPWHCSDRRV